MPTARTIATALNAVLDGPDMEISAPRSLASAASGTMVFLGRADTEAIDRLNQIGGVLCLTTTENAPLLSCAVIQVEQPRLAFCRMMQRFFQPPARPGIHPDATIAASARLGAGVSIGAGCRIGEGVHIGDGSQLGCNVVVTDGVRIGTDCHIKANTTIGERGFGFALDEKGLPISFPHIGTVRIGDHVEIGANCTVVRAALDATVLMDHVKTDDHVHIAHNCHVGPRCRIAAGAVLSGSVTLGADVWVSPNATLIDYAEIGDGAFIGLGSVVTKSVAAGVRVFGSPAKPIGQRHS